MLMYCSEALNSLPICSLRASLIFLLISMASVAFAERWRISILKSDAIESLRRTGRADIDRVLCGAGSEHVVRYRRPACPGETVRPLDAMKLVGYRREAHSYIGTDERNIGHAQGAVGFDVVNFLLPK